MKKLLYILVALILAIVSLVIPAIWPDTKVAHAQTVDIPITAKIVPSEIGIDKGLLKVTLDFYFGPGSTTYESMYIDVLDGPPPKDLTGDELAAWYKTAPKHKELTSALKHSIVIDPYLPIQDTLAAINAVFTDDVLVTIDDILSRPESIHLISPYMADKKRLTSKPVNAGDELNATVGIKTLLTTALPDNKLIDRIASGVAVAVAPHSITMGTVPANFSSYGNYNYTQINFNNAANADGTIDTYQVWMSYDTTTFRAGTLYNSAGSTWVTRDSDPTQRSWTAGATRTQTGLDIAVVTGDYPGFYMTDGQIEGQSTGGSGRKYFSGERIDPADSASYTSESGWQYSLYMTGTEPSAGANITSTPHTVSLGSLWESVVTWLIGAEPGWPLTSGNSTITVANYSGYTVNVTANITITGGSLSITNSTPGLNQIRVTAYKVGDNSTDNITLTGTQQAFITNLADSDNIGVELKIQAGDFDGSVGATGNFTVEFVGSP